MGLPVGVVISALCVLGVSGPLRADTGDFPRASYEHYLKYLLHLKSERPDLALSELVLAYQTNPEAYELLGEIAGRALDLGKMDIASFYAQRAMEARPRDPRSFLLMAQVLHLQERDPEAIALLEEARRMDPKNADVVLKLAAIEAQSGNRGEASRHLDTYQELVPDSLEFLRFKASYELGHKDPKAIETYGIFKGVLLAARRLLLCHPFHPGGYDPLTRYDG